MSNPLPLPIRVYVTGASTVGWSGTMSGPRTDMGFPRVLERDLLASGQATDIRCRSVAGMPTAEIRRSWERELVGFSPDAIVIMAGHYETLHVLWPQRLERYANSLSWAPRPLNALYRKRLLRPLWRLLVKFQTQVESKVPGAVWRRRVGNAVADIRKTIVQARQLHSPLVIVMEVPSPSAPGRYLFPGLPERIGHLNGLLAAMVAGFGEDDVRLFRTNELVESYADGDHEAALPDGFHFAPPVHQLVGRRLAEEVGAWALTQPHLKG